MVRFILFVLVAMFALAKPSAAQSFNNWWMIGQNTGLHFTGSNVVAFDDSSYYFTESLASVSNSDGELLFYTNGFDIYNANHQIMVGGGSVGWQWNNSTSQALIVKVPRSDSLYYLFIQDAFEDYNNDPLPQFRGLSYNIIDMSAQGGLGQVMEAQHPVIDSTTEKITAVRHCNGRDIWIIIHKMGNSDFLSYLMTPSGLSNQPVVSTVGKPVTPLLDIPGWMIASPDGKIVALAHHAYKGYNTKNVCIYSFNNSTGILSNEVQLSSRSTTVGTSRVYGLAFSPDNSKLYASNSGGLDEQFGSIVQWDLTAPDILSTVTSVDTFTDYRRAGALSLGLDGKIYVVSSGDFDISVIDSPNANGIGCSYHPAVFQFPAQQLGPGLPNNWEWEGFSHSAFDLGPHHIACKGSVVTLSADPGWPAYQWSTGDTGTTIAVIASGKYWCSILTECGWFTDTVVVSEPAIFLGNDTAKCAEHRLTLSVDTTYASVQWQDGSAAHAISAQDAGIYWVTAVSPEGCVVSDTILVYIRTPAITIAEGEQVKGLAGNTIDLHGSGGTNYRWSPPDYLSTTSMPTTMATLTTNIRYTLSGTDSAGCAGSDSVRVLIALAEPSIPTSFTPNGDGLNDYFRPFFGQSGINDEVRLTVFNRWGVSVYDSKNIPDGWDGTTNGNLCETGTYYYIITIGTADNKREYKGDVTLLR